MVVSTREQIDVSTISAAKARHLGGTTARTLILFVALVLVVGPLALMLITSLKSSDEIFGSPTSFPITPVFENYARAWEAGGIPTKALNSVLVTVISVLMSTVTGAAAGYVCARIRPQWIGSAITVTFALGLFLPVQSALVTLFAEMNALGLLGTLWPLILINAASQLPLTVVLFSAFFSVLPIEIEEAAFVDGANRLGVLFRIVVPLAKPAVATSVILGVISVWNDYFTALVFSTNETVQTLPLGLAVFKDTYSTDWGASLAYSTIVAIPVLLLYIVLQRYIIDGVASGAVRG
jgi:raffinose/stachyose/melibiose transport system permease protein